MPRVFVFFIPSILWGNCISQLDLQNSYILFSVLFQTKSSLVWKSYTQKLRTIFQTNSSLVWKEKNWFCKTQIPNQIQIGLENFDDHCQCPENSKPNSVWFGKIIDRILSRALLGGLIVIHLPLDILALLRGLCGALMSRGLKANWFWFGKGCWI